MAGLFGILNQGSSGLMASRFAMNVTSQNVTNVNTPGYTRRTAVLSPVLPPPPGGGGVNIVGIHRFVNNYLEQRVFLGVSEKSYADVADSPLKQAEVMLASEDGVGSDPASALDNLFSSIKRLEAEPDDTALRREVLSSAKDLAVRINAAHDGIKGARDEADLHIRDMASKATELMQKIAALNKKIGSSTYEAAPDLRDQRNQALKDLAEIIDITVKEDSLGKVTVLGSGGINLVQGEVTGELRAVSSSGLGGYAELQFVEHSGTIHPITHAVRGGALGSLLNLRDNVMVDLNDKLDQFAYDTATAFNNVHSAGFGLDGVSGRNLFVQPLTVSGAAAAFSIDPSVDDNPDAVAAATDPTQLPGDNTNLHNLSALQDSLVANGGTKTLSQAYSDIVAKIGIEKRSNDNDMSFKADALQQLENMREEVSGVSVDEEMVNMMQFQRAYQASTKVLQTTNDMLDTLMNLT